MKKILLLFLSALLSFVLLSSIDEYENVVAPYFRGGDRGYEDLLQEVNMRESIEDFITNFNTLLSDIHLSGDPSKVSELPASSEVKKEFGDEIFFFEKRGQVMDLLVDEVDFSEIKVLSPTSTRLEVREKVRVRYIGKGRETKIPYIKKKLSVIYTLSAGPEGLIVNSIEVVPVEELKKD